MSKLAFQLIRETIYEFGLAQCVYHPDDLPASSASPGDGGGSSGSRRIRLRLPRVTGFDEIIGFA
jgi:hypothetical protein